MSASTFFALLKLADLNARQGSPPRESAKEKKSGALSRETDESKSETVRDPRRPSLDLRYNVEIHLPASKDIEVYNAIFRSLKEHLLEK